jgi:hypothetical protein
MKEKELVGAFVRHLDEILVAQGLTLAVRSRDETEWRGPLFEGNDAFVRLVFDVGPKGRVRTRASVGLTSRFQAHLEKCLRLWECLPARTFDTDALIRAQTVTIVDAWLEWLIVGGRLPIPRIEFDRDTYRSCAAYVADAALLHGRALWRKCDSPALAADLLRRLDEYPGENRHGAPISSDRFLFAAVLLFLAGDLVQAREELDVGTRYESAKIRRLGLGEDAIHAYVCKISRVRAYFDHPFRLDGPAYGLYAGDGSHSPIDARRRLLGEVDCRRA